MPLFVSDEEFSQLRNDPVQVADKADAFIRNLYNELETVRAQADASSMTAEQTCSLLEQKYLSLSTDFSELQSRNAQLQSSLDERISELAQVRADKHQLHLQSVSTDFEFTFWSCCYEFLFFVQFDLRVNCSIFAIWSISYSSEGFRLIRIMIFVFV